MLSPETDDRIETRDSRQLNVRVPATLARALRAAAEAEAESQSTLVRRALRQALTPAGIETR